MNLKKKCSVVMLPTNEKAVVFLTKDKLEYHKSFTEHGQTNLTKMHISNHIKPYHLYILGDDKIEKNDWFIYNDKLFNEFKTTITPTVTVQIRYYPTKDLSEQFIEIYISDCKKITASTDKSLNLPQPSPQFIQKYCDEYNKGNQITDVMVEYCQIGAGVPGYPKTLKDAIFVPQIDKNNCITVTKIKEQYTLKEISDAFKLEGIHYTENFLYKILNQ
jgi:hypothetical protein